MKTYKVAFVPTMEAKGKLIKTKFPIRSLDLAVELEALLNENRDTGYEFVQIVESQRESELGKDDFGFFLIFKKE